MPKFIHKGTSCPHCGGELDSKTLASAFGAMGGAKSKRKITPKQQRKMQEARRKAQEAKKAEAHKSKAK